MKKAYELLRIGLWSMIGVLLGGSLYRLYEHNTRPGLDALAAAPWYRGIQIALIAALVCLALLLAMRWIKIRKH